MVVYGVVDELLQTPVGRTADVKDWFADVAGAVIGIVVLHACQRLPALLRKRPASR